MDLPLPELENKEVGPLWQAAQRCELRLPRCRSCGRIDWYPRGTCRACASADISWTALSGKATLFSWAVVRRALDPRLASLVPYISAIVTLDEDPQSRFVTRLVDIEADALSARMPVQVCFRDLGFPAYRTGLIAPLFTGT